MTYRPPERATSRPALLVALLISLLLHQLLVTALVAFWTIEEPEPEQRHEVALVTEEPPPQQPPATPPAPPVPPAPPTKQPRRPQPQRPEPTPPTPPAPAAEPAGEPTAEPSPEPLATAPEPPPPDPEQMQLKMDWAEFEQTFAEASREEREEYHRQSQEKRRGGLKFGSFTGKVRRAIANNRSWVAAGNQEPLGKRQIIFRNYIEAAHDRIHSLFADSFLASLNALDPSDPLNDQELMTKMEFEVLSSGALNEIRVIQSSGNTVFDAAAVDSIYRSGPFPPPPRAILSWNDRVYFRWGFFRNRRKCGVFNAEPYILRAPDAAPEALDPGQIISDDG